MSPNGKKLWKVLPIGVWVERDKLCTLFPNVSSHHFTETFQRAISDLSNAHLIEFRWKGRGSDTRQLIRRKPIDEIQKLYLKMTSPKSPKFRRMIFYNMMVQCPQIKTVKFANPLTYGAGSRKRKPDPRVIQGWDEDY